MSGVNKVIGERNCNAKLKDQDIIRIRNYYSDNKFNQYELAEMFGVSQPAIGRIVRKETWRHV